MAPLYPAELADAEVVNLMPASCPGDAFDRLVAVEPRLLFVVTPVLELIVAPLTYRGIDVRHSALARGGAVLAAGEISLVDLGGGSKLVLELTTQSGHYQPQEGCLHLVAEVLRTHLIEVPEDLLPAYPGA